MNFQNAEFIKSAAKISEFPADGKHIVFAGRSNVGKSSVINRLFNRRNFARVGAQPGKTRHVNFFKIDDGVYIVDLPGYGYAKVSKTEKERWGRLLEAYFAEAELITAGVLIVDIRHKPTGDDVLMANWFVGTGKPFLIIANKLDKLRPSMVALNLKLIRQTLDIGDDIIIVPFSAEKGTGRDEFKDALLKIIENDIY